MAKRIVLAGGGSGGHIYPLITVAEYLRETLGKTTSLEFLYLGPKNNREHDLMQAHHLDCRTVVAGKFRRYLSLHYFVDLLKAPLGLLQAMLHLFMFMPDVVFAKGGYASVPVVLVARLFRIPVVIHESDALPGMANRFLGSISQCIAINFDRAMMHFPSSKTVVTGMPVRQEVQGGDAVRAREFLHLPDDGKPVVMFVGGSQGAKAINDTVENIFEELMAKYHVVHLTGRNHEEIVKHAIRAKGHDPENHNYRALGYVGNEINDLFALADVVVSRAGATTIAEVAANDKPAILVPIPHSANNHQRINAYEVAKDGGAVVLEEDNFKRGMLLFNLEHILQNAEFRKSLQENIRQFYHPQATEKIAQEIMKFL